MSRRKVLLVIAEVFVALLAIIFISPLILVVLNSAKNNQEIILTPLAMPENWATLFSNIANIWSNPNVGYPSALFSSLFITICALGGIVVTSAMAAWVLVRSKSKLSNIIFYIFVAAMVIPFQVVMFPLVKWFSLVQSFTGIQLLRSYTGIIIAYLGFGASLSVFMFHGFIKGIPVEIEEAAMIDGCSRPKTFFSIVLPILKPIVVTVLVLNGIWVWNDYLLPLLVLGKGSAVQTLPLAVSNFAGAFLKQWGLMMTAILLALIPVVFFFILAQKYIIKGMVEGAIKS